jgi:hypothetical protein
MTVPALKLVLAPGFIVATSLLGTAAAFVLATALALLAQALAVTLLRRRRQFVPVEAAA